MSSPNDEAETTLATSLLELRLQAEEQRSLWQKHLSSDGKPYYFNAKTQESIWDPPDVFKSDRELLTQHCDWKDYDSEDGRKYYHNAQTSVTSWEEPQELVDVRALAQILAKYEKDPNATFSPEPSDPAETEKDETSNDSMKLIESLPKKASTGDDENLDAGLPDAADNDDKVEREERAKLQEQLSSLKRDELDSLDRRHAQALFKELLLIHDVPLTCTWEQCVNILQRDPRYENFKKFSDRKLVFNNYKQIKRNEEQEQERKRRVRCRQALEQFLRKHPAMTHELTFKDAMEIFGKAPAWINVELLTRREMFEDYAWELEMKFEQQEEIAIENAKRELASIIRCMPAITCATTWVQFTELMQSAPDDKFQLFENMPILQAVDVFKQYMNELESKFTQEQDENKLQRKAVERRNREKFNIMLRKLHERHKIKPHSKWKEVFPELKSEPAFLNILYNRRGSDPLELFKLYVCELNALADAVMPTAKLAVDKADIVLNKTSDESFKKFCGLVESLEAFQSLSPCMKRSIFELMASAQAVERKKLACRSARFTSSSRHAVSQFESVDDSSGAEQPAPTKSSPIKISLSSRERPRSRRSLSSDSERSDEENKHESRKQKQQRDRSSSSVQMPKRYDREASVANSDKANAEKAIDTDLSDSDVVTKDDRFKHNRGTRQHQRDRYDDEEDQSYLTEKQPPAEKNDRLLSTKKIARDVDVESDAFSESLSSKKSPEKRSKTTSQSLATPTKPASDRVSRKQLSSPLEKLSDSGDDSLRKKLPTNAQPDIEDNMLEHERPRKRGSEKLMKSVPDVDDDESRPDKYISDADDTAYRRQSRRKSPSVSEDVEQRISPRKHVRAIDREDVDETNGGNEKLRRADKSESKAARLHGRKSRTDAERTDVASPVARTKSRTDKDDRSAVKNERASESDNQPRRTRSIKSNDATESPREGLPDKLRPGKRDTAEASEEHVRASKRTKISKRRFKSPARDTASPLSTSAVDEELHVTSKRRTISDSVNSRRSKAESELPAMMPARTRSKTAHDETKDNSDTRKNEVDVDMDFVPEAELRRLVEDKTYGQKHRASSRLEDAKVDELPSLGNSSVLPTKPDSHESRSSGRRSDEKLRRTKRQHSRSPVAEREGADNARATPSASNTALSPRKGASSSFSNVTTVSANSPRVARNGGVDEMKSGRKAVPAISTDSGVSSAVEYVKPPTKTTNASTPPSTSSKRETASKKRIELQHESPASQKVADRVTLVADSSRSAKISRASVVNDRRETEQKQRRLSDRHTTSRDDDEGSISSISSTEDKAEKSAVSSSRLQPANNSSNTANTELQRRPTVQRFGSRQQQDPSNDHRNSQSMSSKSVPKHSSKRQVSPSSPLSLSPMNDVGELVEPYAADEDFIKSSIPSPLNSSSARPLMHIRQGRAAVPNDGSPIDETSGRRYSIASTDKNRSSVAPVPRVNTVHSCTRSNDKDDRNRTRPKLVKVLRNESFEDNAAIKTYGGKPQDEEEDVSPAEEDDGEEDQKKLRRYSSRRDMPVRSNAATQTSHASPSKGSLLVTISTRPVLPAQPKPSHTVVRSTPSKSIVDDAENVSDDENQTENSGKVTATANNKSVFSSSGAGIFAGGVGLKRPAALPYVRTIVRSDVRPLPPPQQQGFAKFNFPPHLLRPPTTTTAGSKADDNSVTMKSPLKPEVGTPVAPLTNSADTPAKSDLTAESKEPVSPEKSLKSQSAGMPKSGGSDKDDGLQDKRNELEALERKRLELLAQLGLE